MRIYTKRTLWQYIYIALCTAGVSLIFSVAFEWDNIINMWHEIIEHSILQFLAIVTFIFASAVWGPNE